MIVSRGDIVVIGGGPAGYVAAIIAAQHRQEVVLVEKGHLGGTCLNVGCIPTKTLAKTAALYTMMHRLNEFGIRAGKPAIEWGKVQQRKENIIKSLRQGVANLLKSNGVKVVQGEATLVSPKTVQVKHPDGEVNEINAKKIIIATGSVATRIPGWVVDENNILSSTGILGLEKLPASLIIIGGGVIGMEFASIFQSLGTQVTVIEVLPRLLNGMDASLVALLQKDMQRQGIKFFLETRVSSIESRDNEVTVFCQQGTQQHVLKAEKVLVAAGRAANTASLGLEKLGIAMQGKNIKVNPRMETTIPGIYAAGDVIGGYQLAHVAFAEGEVAARNACGDSCEIDYRGVPLCVYTYPELAQVGLSQDEVDKEKVVISIGEFPLTANGKALIEGEKLGLVKVIQEKTYGEILGISILGSHATELIAEATLAIHNELTIEELISTIHAHPTVAETLREAALVAAGRPIHMMKRL
ncbi:pyruvate/2-oxoglutarate dehydrogenase complex, dihydrolipoamide dehydrogenase (E3) component, and related enzymes [Moorella thermoacetica Y72]|uniref:Dihydrolipoyl dehydrogenase n=1 Tax=Moorella thermoacetica Y72 TaxID=1325331 RepID=A0A0S6U9Z0_NEOTH|nr:dihydrolipoyl dehydrogenase [Moorella thermoacetica]GAF24989.1 pyruvate/2-oxoglutarate dehydrogenase complex, dihydrolipoamide dehydrogenase (E3) component, and related enzymes [Moorella thermoacetica Y72]